MKLGVHCPYKNQCSANPYSVSMGLAGSLPDSAYPFHVIANLLGLVLLAVQICMLDHFSVLAHACNWFCLNELKLILFKRIVQCHGNNTNLWRCGI